MRPTAPEAAGPRDPAASLTEAERATYGALVGRGVGEEEAAVLAADADLLALFEETVAAHDAPREAAVLLVHDLRPALGDTPASASKATGAALADVLRLGADGTLTRKGAAEVVGVLAAEGSDVGAIIRERSLAAVRDDAALAPAVEAALADNSEEVVRYRAGEAKLFGFFVGQAMRRAGKGADAQAVQALLRDRLGG